jgi:hypothetical protein
MLTSARPTVTPSDIPEVLNWESEEIHRMLAGSVVDDDFDSNRERRSLLTAMSLQQWIDLSA